VLHDEEANGAFLSVLRAELAPRIALHELPCTINDPVFASGMAHTVLRELGAVK
jgi:uncharacterized protein (UPF0261 family)